MLPWLWGELGAREGLAAEGLLLEIASVAVTVMEGARPVWDTCDTVLCSQLGRLRPLQVGEELASTAWRGVDIQSPQ